MVDLGDINAAGIGLSAVGGLFGFIVMYFDQNITVRLVNARENKLKKGYLSLPAGLASCWQEFPILQAGISNSAAGIPILLAGLLYRIPQSCRQDCVNAAIPLPADNTWACRGAPPAPWSCVLLMALNCDGTALLRAEKSVGGCPLL